MLRRFGALLRRARLTFDEPLESEFRVWYAEHTRSRIRNAMWFAMGNIILATLASGPFRLVRNEVFGPENQLVVDILCLGLIVPSALALLIVSSMHRYDRWFRVTAQIIAPLHAAAFIAMDLLMQPRGYSLAACMPLIVLGPYFLFGMLQAQAVRTALFVVATYAVVGELAGLDDAQRRFDVGVTAFAALLGAIMHYSFQRGVRRNYFAKHMLTESVHRDSLTGIHNRRMFDEHMARVWQQATREQVADRAAADRSRSLQGVQRPRRPSGRRCLSREGREPAAVRSRAVRSISPRATAARNSSCCCTTRDASRSRRCAVSCMRALGTRAIPHPASAVGRHVTFSIGAACVEPQRGSPCGRTDSARR